VIGLGGGSLAMFLFEHLRTMQLACVELDPAVVAVAQSWFGFPAPADLDARRRLAVHVADGAAAVASFWPARFDWDLPMQRLFLPRNIEGATAAARPRVCDGPRRGTRPRREAAGGGAQRGAGAFARARARARARADRSGRRGDSGPVAAGHSAGSGVTAVVGAAAARRRTA
jgi:hypothetical protein